MSGKGGRLLLKKGKILISPRKRVQKRVPNPDPWGHGGYSFSLERGVLFPERKGVVLFA